MKLVSFDDHGREGFGVWSDGGISDLSVTFPRAGTLRQLLASMPLGQVAEAATRSPLLEHGSVTLLPPITDAGKILCVGLNYHDHRAETASPVQSHPTVFTRFNDSHVGHGAQARYPTGTEQLDFEGELAVIISRDGWQIDPADAESYILGYSIYNDLSARDFQLHTTQWTAGKNFFESGGFGPWIVTRDEIPDVRELQLSTRVDGETMQSASVADLIFDIPQLLAYVSTFTPLKAGDIIVSGTPGGVGMARKPPVYLKPGQTVEVEVSGIGVLSNTIGPATVPQTAAASQVFA